MYATGNKKMLNMLILDILKDYTDENHRITQKDIINLLEKNYEVICDRKVIGVYIKLLTEMGYDILHDSKGYYLTSREFDEAELRLLIDSVLFSKNLSSQQAYRLIEKLTAQGSRYFNAKVKHICNLSSIDHSDNACVMCNIDVLNNAIFTEKKVSFIYNAYGIDKKLHPRRKERYVVSPYQMVVSNGWYYLIGNYDKYDNVSYYRIDKMTKIKLEDESIKPKKKIDDFNVGYGYNLPKHMAEHIYMFSGKRLNFVINVEPFMVDTLFDWFGKDFIVANSTDDTVTIRVVCNEEAMICWALQYGRFVEIVEPKEVREKMKEYTNEMYKMYYKNI